VTAGVVPRTSSALVFQITRTDEDLLRIEEAMLEAKVETFDLHVSHHSSTPQTVLLLAVICLFAGLDSVSPPAFVDEKIRVCVVCSVWPASVCCEANGWCPCECAPRSTVLSAAEHML
jgi:hypothetical protein